MIILSSGKDWIRVASSKWIYEYTGLNPYQIRQVKRQLKYGEGKAWCLLKRYNWTREGIPCG